MLIALDPGAEQCGIALFDDSELTCAWLARLPPKTREPKWPLMARVCYESVLEHVAWAAVQEIAIERPQVYVLQSRKGDPNDLITLALVAGMFGGLFGSHPTMIEYKPREWKGQVPKDVMTERIKTRLSVAELSYIEETPKSLLHNVFDAIGIGLHHVGRKRGRKNAT